LFFSVKSSKTLIFLDIFLSTRRQYKMSNILHNHFFLILACLIKLAMSLIDVVLDLRELLHSPLAHIDQCPHLLPRSRIQSGQCTLELPRELRIVRGHKVEQV
jgi:hypothetical protein